MLCTFIGFLLGSLIPYMARRFAKFMPATPAYALYRLIKPVKKASKKNSRYYKLLKEYRIRSLIFAVLSGVLSYLLTIKFEGVQIWFWLLFLWTLLLLSEIDLKMQLLPDLLTVPLLIIGFLFAVTFNLYIDPFESALSAFCGYYIPVIAAVLMLFYSKEAFGGGDIKLLAAIGAWVGLYGLLGTILLACFLFAGFAICKKIRVGAFGPSLTIAAIVVLFLI
ncbi:MAG: prepilin peptidase [Alphaproteobacteria bacterium]|nr:prepilin peptidase [Alphaproteobacteria bacterium]